MYYPNELAHYKHTNFKHPSGLMTFKKPRRPKSRQGLVKILRGMLKFCGNTIHGMNYIWEPGARPTVRLFWLLIMVTAFVGCILMYIMITYRHGEEVLVTVVETSRLPIHSITFPAVAVCPFNHINWMRYKAAEQKFLPPNSDAEVRKIFYDLLLVIERITFTALDPIELLLTSDRVPRPIQNIVLYDLAQFMALRCDEVFVWCIYDETLQDCCKIFITERTERGICLVFNSLISDESKIKQLYSYLKNFERQKNIISTKCYGIESTTMFYPNELVRYKNTNFPYPQGLQIFKPFPDKDKKQIQANLLDRFLKFSENCFHGVQYIFLPGTRPIIRLFWSSIAMAAVAASIVMYIMLTNRHQEQVLITVVESSHLPIYNIRFPAVAVCPFGHVNWMRYQAAEERFLPHNPSAVAKNSFHDLMIAIESITFTSLGAIGPFLKSRYMPRVVRDINLYQLAQFMAFRCNEVFTWCAYDETEQDCCKIFVHERTERGICLVFNSLVSEESKIKQLTDAFYPWRSRSSGEGSGLSFGLSYNKTLVGPESKLPFSFSVLIKEADEWSDSLFQILHKNTHNNIMVTPVITETSTNARNIDPQKRHCLFANEKSTKYDRIEGLSFNKLNCQVQCEQKFVMKYCNCTLSMFFPGMPEYPNRECRVSDLRCIYEHKDVFNYIKGPYQDEYINDTRRGMMCECVNHCTSLMFLVKLNAQPLPSSNSSITEISADIFFGKNTLTKYAARLQYTYMDLVSNFGGIMGLCMGASVLSLAEVIYATFRTFLVFLVYKWNKKRKQRRVKPIRREK